MTRRTTTARRRCASTRSRRTGTSPAPSRSWRSGAPSEARAAAGGVDPDVHPVPRIGELTEYTPEPYRSKYWARRRVGETNTYDAPDYYRAQAMRLDSFPEDGNFPGSDPEMAFR